jgi:hypothetical protein
LPLWGLTPCSRPGNSEGLGKGVPCQSICPAQLDESASMGLLVLALYYMPFFNHGRLGWWGLNHRGQTSASGVAGRTEPGGAQGLFLASEPSRPQSRPGRPGDSHFSHFLSAAAWSLMGSSPSPQEPSLPTESCAGCECPCASREAKGGMEEPGPGQLLTESGYSGDASGLQGCCDP